MRRSILLPYTDSNPIQVFLDDIAALHYDGSTTVELTLDGIPTPLEIPVTDATDAAALLLQINFAYLSTGSVTVITGNPATGGVPAGLAATDEYGEIILTWTALASNYTYNIYRSTVSGSGYSLIGASAAATFTDGTVDFPITPNVVYYYVITSVSPRGESAYSSEVNGTSLIPTTPTTLAVVAGAYSNALTWDAVVGDTLFPTVSYKIYRDGVFASTSDTNSFTDTGLNAGQLYSYTVSAVINSIEGLQCAAQTGTPTASTAPTNVQIVPGYYLNTISWDAVASADYYTIYRSTTTGTETYLTSGVTDLFYADLQLRYDTTYFYKVTATVAGIETDLSAEVSGMPSPAAFVSYSPDPMTILGGTLTFSGAGFDPNQNGTFRYNNGGGDVDAAASYIDGATVSVNISGGFAGDVQYSYIVNSGLLQPLPFLVANS